MILVPSFVNKVEIELFTVQQTNNNYMRKQLILA